MEIAAEFKSSTGGTVRIMTDCLPRTAEERAQRERKLWAVCRQVLANAAETLGTEATLQLMADSLEAHRPEKGYGYLRKEHQPCTIPNTSCPADAATLNTSV